MFRWDEVPEIVINEKKLKLYRELYKPKKVIRAQHYNKELDHMAYDYFGTELYMYKLLDTNFLSFLEERGEVPRMKELLIPVQE